MKDTKGWVSGSKVSRLLDGLARYSFMSRMERFVNAECNDCSGNSSEFELYSGDSYMLGRLVYYSFRMFGGEPKQKQDMRQIQVNKLCKRRWQFFLKKSLGAEQMKIQKVFSVFVIFLILPFSFGCKSSNKISPELMGTINPSEKDVTPERYILQPADEVTVLSSRVPELHEQTQTIRPDGKISFENIGEVSVAGKTPKEAAKLIGEHLSKLYALQGENPIDVRLSINRSMYYYVIGQVAVPGAKIFTGRETTLSAISKSIPNLRAWEDKIQLIRLNVGENRKAKICEVKFDKMVIKGEMRYNFLLEEGDIIYVPPTILAAIGLTVAEIVSPIIGVGTALTVTGGVGGVGVGGGVPAP